MLVRWLVLALIALALTPFASCDCGGVGGVGSTCTKADECGDGLACVDGKCAPATTGEGEGEGPAGVEGEGAGEGEGDGEGAVGDPDPDDPNKATGDSDCDGISDEREV